jgi:hypothetical protein
MPLLESGAGYAVIAAISKTGPPLIYPDTAETQRQLEALLDETRP